jgi:hypothetical protein
MNSYMSPITDQFARDIIGASGSILMATISFAAFIPA